MKKSRLFFMFAALFVAAAVMFSCQKEEVVSLEEGLMLKGLTLEACQALCIKADEWSDEVTFSATSNAATVTIKVSNSATQVKYVITSNNDIGRINWGEDQLEYDPVLGSDTEVVLYKDIDVFGVDWLKCDLDEETFDVRKVNAPGEGAGVLTTVSTEYYLIGVCSVGPPDDGCTEWMEESSFAGSDIVDAKPWFYYYEGGYETLWGGQDIDVGYVDVDDGDLVIELTGGWQLQPGEETVKVYGYVDMPTYRPNPGGKTSEYSAIIYKGTSLTIEDLETYDYYVIHVDVRKCMDE